MVSAAGMSMVVALGGNALIKHDQRGTLEQQLRNAEDSMRHIARLTKHRKIIITHGNGPQVGALLLQQENKAVPGMPLEALVAESQGFIGYMLQNKLISLGVKAATVVTQVVVDAKDPAFKKPTKPIGPFYKEWHAGMMWDAGRGYRKVVPSPEPREIVEREAVTQLMKTHTVITCGGGGIPVVRKGDEYDGVEAVIDKDLAAELLARTIEARELAILTDVPGVYANFGKRTQALIRELNTREAKALLPRMAEGSMKPKLLAAMRFVQHGDRAVICHLNEIEQALKGETGTEITR
jgi:carbamate kinase